VRRFVLAIFGSLFWMSMAWADAQPGAFKMLTEVDQSPQCVGWQIIASNGTVTENSDGTCSLTTGGGGTPTWDAILSPVGNQALNMGAFTTDWTNVGNWTMQQFGAITLQLATGNRVLLQDVPLMFDAPTSGDTDFWLDVIDDKDGSSDDYLTIGSGTTSGTNPHVYVTSAGLVGLDADPANFINQLVMSSTNAFVRGIGIEGIITDPIVDFYKSEAGGTKVFDGANLGQWNLYGNDGTNYIRGGTLNFEVDGTTATGIIPTSFHIDLMNAAGVTVTRFRFDNTNQITVEGDQATLSLSDNSGLGKKFELSVNGNALFIANATDNVQLMILGPNNSVYLPTITNCNTLGTTANGKVVCTS
jgi:hypothetical protein